MEKVCKKISSAIGALKRIRSFIKTKVVVQVYFVLIQPHFDYCCSVWDGLGETVSTKIQKLQNRVVRVITSLSYDTNSSVLLNALELDNLYIYDVVTLKTKGSADVQNTKKEYAFIYTYTNPLFNS